MSDESAEILFLYSKVSSITSLPRGVDSNADGLVSALKLLSRVASSDKVKHCLEANNKILKTITEECLRNGYIHALANNDNKTAQTCFNILINKSCTSDKSVTQLEDSCSNSIYRTDSSYARKIEPGSAVTKIRVEADIHNLQTSRNHRTEPLTSDSEEGSESHVGVKRRPPSRNKALPSKSKEHYNKNTENAEYAVKKSKSKKTRSLSDSEVQECSEQVINNRRARPAQAKKPMQSRDYDSETSLSPSLVERKHANKRTSKGSRARMYSSESEASLSPSPVKRKNANKKPTKGSHASKYPSESEAALSPSPVKGKNANNKLIKGSHARMYSSESEANLSPSPVKRKIANKKPTKGSRARMNSFESEATLSLSPVKRKNANKKLSKESRRMSSSESETDEENISSPKNKNISKRSGSLKAQEKTTDKKQEKKKPVKARKKPVKSSENDKENIEVKNNDKSKSGVSTKGSTGSPALLNNSKFMSRLKQLESSILDGTPDPLNKNNSKSSAKTSSQGKNKVTNNSSNDKKNVKSTNKKVPAQTKASKTTKKMSPPAATTPPVVANAKKPAGSKAKATTSKPLAKQPARVRNKKAEKSGAVKNKKNNSKAGQETANKSKDKVTQKKAKQPVEKKPKQKTVKPDVDKAEDKTTELESENENKEIDNTGEDSLSEESCLSDIEPELGSLSSCLNSIKKKLPRQVGTATPPLKIFLQANVHSDSDNSEASSFQAVPVKVDDINIVKRMAKANKPKESNRPQQPSALNEKANQTPEALRKIIKIKKKIDHSSDLECSSFSDN